MIVRETESDLYLITQPDHAVLAAEIMTSWKHNGWPDHPRRDLVETATLHHDCGWKEVDASPRTDPVTGMPFSVFNLPLGERHAVWYRGVERTAEMDPYIGALVAHHAVTVYSRFNEVSEWHRFFQDMREMRKEHLAKSGLDMDTLEADYAIVALGDRASLVFCFATPESSILGYDLRLTGAAEAAPDGELDGGRLVFSPDGFEGGESEISVIARQIPKRPFASDEDLAAALATAPAVRILGQVSGAVSVPAEAG